MKKKQECIVYSPSPKYTLYVDWNRFNLVAPREEAGGRMATTKVLTAAELHALVCQAHARIQETIVRTR